MPGPARREAILRAAREAFARRGFHGAGTAAIAAAAGCSEAVLYRHFPSKRALLAAVMRREAETQAAAGRALAPPPEVVAAGGAAAAALPDVLAARLDDPDFRVTLRLVVLALGVSDDPEVAGTLVHAFATVRRPLVALLEEGRRRGELRVDLDPEDLAWLWHGLFLVTALRGSIRDDGAAEAGVRAARVLAALSAPV